MEKIKTPPPIGNADRSGGVLATSILALTTVVLVIALRFITRIWLVKKVGWDDWCIVFAGFGHMVGMGLITKQIGYGFGRPAYYLNDHQYQEFSKYAYGEWLQTFATLTFTKLSICLLLLRITITKAFIRPLYAAIFVLIVSNVVLSILWIVQCRPHLDKAWNSKLPGKCFTKGQIERIIISQAIISIISDYFLSAFPILILRKVQISFRSKVGLCLLMGLGVITGSLSLVRTVLNYQNVTNDPTWLVIPNWYWRTWEVLFGVVAACAPTLRPLYKKIREECTRLAQRDKSTKQTTSKWSLLKSGRIRLPWRSRSHYTRRTGTGDDFLPLQNVEGGSLSNGFDAKKRAQDLGPQMGFHNELGESRSSETSPWKPQTQIEGKHGLSDIGSAV